jgi:hypothetical protein
MGNSLNALLSELEASRGELDACKLLACDTPHEMLMAVDLQTCHELRALADVFGCEPAHLGFVILKYALADIHEGLDDDLARLAQNARRTMSALC